MRKTKTRLITLAVSAEIRTV